MTQAFSQSEEGNGKGLRCRFNELLVANRDSLNVKSSPPFIPVIAAVFGYQFIGILPVAIVGIGSCQCRLEGGAEERKMLCSQATHF